MGMRHPFGQQHIIEITAQEIRDIFNAMEIARKARRRILRREVVWIGRTVPRHLPRGSRSIVWRYRLPNNNWALALAHVYLGRGGRLLTEPDPKEIRIDNLTLRPGHAV